MGETVDIRFRQAKPADAEAILSLKQAAIESTAETYSDEQVSAWRPTEEALPVFQQAMESDQFVVLLAEEHEDVAGYGVLNIQEARIDAVFVHPERAGRGLGTSLVRQLETRAAMYGLTELDVVSSINAQPFYEALGYEPVESRTRTIDGVDLSFVAVHKTLD